MPSLLGARRGKESKWEIQRIEARGDQWLFEKIKVFLKNQKHEPNIVEITHLCIMHGAHTSVCIWYDNQNCFRGSIAQFHMLEKTWIWSSTWKHDSSMEGEFVCKKNMHCNSGTVYGMVKCRRFLCTCHWDRFCLWFHSLDEGCYPRKCNIINIVQLL